jgi:hypothetical protein
MELINRLLKDETESDLQLILNDVSPITFNVPSIKCPLNILSRGRKQSCSMLGIYTCIYGTLNCQMFSDSRHGAQKHQQITFFSSYLYPMTLVGHWRHLTQCQDNQSLLRGPWLALGLASTCMLPLSVVTLSVKM